MSGPRLDLGSTGLVLLGVLSAPMTQTEIGQRIRGLLGTRCAFADGLSVVQTARALERLDDGGDPVIVAELERLEARGYASRVSLSANGTTLWWRNEA